MRQVGSRAEETKAPIFDRDLCEGFRVKMFVGWADGTKLYPTHACNIDLGLPLGGVRANGQRQTRQRIGIGHHNAGIQRNNTLLIGKQGIDVDLAD